MQIDLAGEATKFGAAAGEARRILDAALDARAVRMAGLMLVPPWNEDQEQTRPWFVRLRELRDAWRSEGVRPGALRHLSMGMSHDFEAAIEEGATLVRVGTAIFGKRTVARDASFAMEDNMFDRQPGQPQPETPASTLRRAGRIGPGGARDADRAARPAAAAIQGGRCAASTRPRSSRS